jgi:predicted aspartyl protease
VWIRGVREIEAVVDTGAVMVLLPQDIVEDLGLQISGRFIVQLADDRKVELPYTEGFHLTVAGREMAADCLVGPPGCEALVGQLVMERLDLIPDPVLRTLTVRPESPFRPTLKMKELTLS